MIHWTDIEKSKEGLLRILEVIKNYEKDGEVYRGYSTPPFL